MKFDTKTFFENAEFNDNVQIFNFEPEIPFLGKFGPKR